MFAKRHYGAIALAMQETYPRPASVTRLEVWDEVRRALAYTFKEDSARFNEARFIVACLPGRNVRARTAHLKERQEAIEWRNLKAQFGTSKPRAVS